MKRKNLTRNALFTSVISLLLCVSMLVGTTFAWFTDEVVTGMNTIAAGNLDVELLADGVAVKSDTKLFNLVDAQGNDTWWEPGMVVYENLQVANVGTLALKYQMTLNFGKENDLNGHKLSEVLKVAVLDQTIDAGTMTRAQVLALAKASTQVGALNELVLTGELEAETNSPAFAVVIFWEPNDNATDNQYNANNVQTTSDGQPLRIEFGVNLFATQKMLEKDSFGDDYDKNTEVFTVAEANEMLKENLDVTLVGCYEPNGIIEVPTDYTGNLILKNATIKSVQAEGDVNLAIIGKVVVNANGDGVSTLAQTTFNGTAIYAAGDLNITGNGNLTAIGSGKAAFGIGGMDTDSITISGITVDYVEGGEAYGVGADTKYYKDAPEGGAAIGSAKNGAVITLNGVTVTKAIGGSKAAAIGARYHIGVTVNITNSTIRYAEGGVSAAGIGGSRVSSGASENGTVINITNSNVTAKGGAYGAGIGSGYDTHCQASQPLCTINISDSTINAIGGKYAAGVGTGYHHAALAGEIKNSTVTAASGEKVYKDTYTSAMDVGFGVVDPAREGQQTDSYIIYNGAKILCNATTASNAEELKEALSAGKNVVMDTDMNVKSGEIMVNGGLLDGNDNTVALTSGTSTEPVLGTTGGTIQNITVSGSGKSVQGIGAGMTTANPLTKDLYLDNVTVDGVMYAVIGTANNVKVVVSDSTLYGAFSYPGASSVEISNSTLGAGNSMYDFFEVAGDTIFEGCAFVDSYCFMAYADAAGKTVTFTNCTVNGEKLTAENFESLLMDTRWDYSSDLCSTNLKDCTIIIDGVEVVW